MSLRERKLQEQQDARLKRQLEIEREKNLRLTVERNEKDRMKRKGFKTLRNSGIFEAHQDLMLHLCQFGMPSLKKNKASNLYEYCAAELLRYERKLQVQRKKDLENRLKIREEIKRVQM